METIEDGRILAVVGGVGAHDCVSLSRFK